jgi:hypothetical protein
MFKSLAGDLDLRGKCSDRLLYEIIEFTRPAAAANDLTTPPQQDLRR